MPIYRWATFTAVGVFALAVGAPAANAQALSAAQKDAIGLTALMERLGLAAPTGLGVTVSQVEAPLTPLSNNYLPNAADSQLALDTIIPKTAGGTTSTHATGIAQAWYGTGGVSPGVSTIDVYNANNWQTDVLRLGAGLPPLVETRKVMNLSWVSGVSAASAEAQDAVRRLDMVAERDKVVVVAAVNNGAGTAVPAFPSSLYNGISVGLSSGASSGGYTTLDFGRAKPDIVVPASTTSTAAAWVSGAASLLIQTAGANSAAAQPTTIKAVMLAGATKREFDLKGSTPSTLDDWSHTATHPLDDRLGAGELNIDNSQRILSAGQQSASNLSEVALAGWDYAVASPSVLQEYFFSIPEGRVAQSVSIIATWNRHIEYSFAIPAKLTPTMADIDLVLSKSQGFDAGDPVQASISTVDNVEHIFVRGLTAGQYSIGIPTDQSWSYSLAWDVLLAVPGDATDDGIVDAADYTVWANHFLMTGATLDDGDFNGDGIVDAGDYTLWANNFSPAAAAPLAALAVPEPAGWLLLAAGLASLLLFGGVGRKLLRR